MKMSFRLASLNSFYYGNYTYQNKQVAGNVDDIQRKNNLYENKTTFAVNFSYQQYYIVYYE